MNITNELITEATERMFSDTRERMSLFDDLLLEQILCNTDYSTIYQ